MQKWLGVEFESACSRTPQFDSFSRDFKKAIKKSLPSGFELASFTKGHFFVSGFVSNTASGKLVFFSTSDVRGFRNDWYNSILIRTAKDLRDFTGGMNHFTSLENFVKVANDLTA